MNVELPDLYERDFYAWAVQTAERLRTRDLASLDWDNIAEEIEGFGQTWRAGAL